MKKASTLRKIPRHWKEALQIANSILPEFKKKTENSPFLEWSSRKSFTRSKLGTKSNPLSLTIRHTTKWSCQHESCDGVNHIKMNLNEDYLEPDNTIDTVHLLLVHELIHYFQGFRKIKKLEVDNSDPDYFVDQYDPYFKYATTWEELDAEIGSYMALHDFVIPDWDDLDDYYDYWYDLPSSSRIAKFAYRKYLPLLNS